MWQVSLILVGLLSVTTCYRNCRPSVTKVSGTRAPKHVCAGTLVFNDEFEKLDLDTWQHEITLAGGGNWEFEYYNNNRTNSFVEDGVLYIKPTLTSDQYGEEFLYKGTLNVDGGAPADKCTNAKWWGCERTGNPTNIINPIKSARLRSVESFSFRYGIVEVSAKLPAGDWLWPAVWLMPLNNAYGSWPASGEIDLVESRGNRDLIKDDVKIGTQMSGSRLHFGPYSELNAWNKTQWNKHNSEGFDQSFHCYKLVWTPDYLKFAIDDDEIGRVTPDEEGFWKIGDFDNNNIFNPWQYGSKMAPFDQRFYIIMNLAVGGVNGYFPDNANNTTPKPWSNTSPKAATDFWEGKEDWLPTWNQDVNEGRNAALQIDYVRVWAL